MTDWHLPCGSMAEHVQSSWLQPQHRKEQSSEFGQWITFVFPPLSLPLVWSYFCNLPRCQERVMHKIFKCLLNFMLPEDVFCQTEGSSGLHLIVTVSLSPAHILKLIVCIPELYYICTIYPFKPLEDGKENSTVWENCSCQPWLSVIDS